MQMQRLWLVYQCQAAVLSELAYAVLYLTINYIAGMADEDFIVETEYLPYVRICVESFLSHQYDQLEYDDKILAKVYYYLARVVWLMGEEAKAAHLYELALSKSSTAFGEHHILTLWIHNNIGLLLEDRMKAFEHFEKALKGMEMILGEEHPETIIVRGSFLSARRQIFDHSTPQTLQQTQNVNDFSRTELFRDLLRCVDRNVKPSLRSNLDADEETRPIPLQIPVPNCDICKRGVQMDYEQLSRKIRSTYNSQGVEGTAREIAGESMLDLINVYLQMSRHFILGDFHGASELHSRAISTRVKRWGTYFDYRVTPTMSNLLANLDAGSTFQPSRHYHDGNWREPLETAMGESNLPKEAAALLLKLDHSWNRVDMITIPVSSESPVTLPHKSSVSWFGRLLSKHLIKPQEVGEISCLVEQFTTNILVYKPLWFMCDWDTHLLGEGILRTKFREAGRSRSMHTTQYLQDANNTAFFLCVVVLGNMLLGENHAALQLLQSVENRILRKIRA
jgi:hypothetical protein